MAVGLLTAKVINTPLDLVETCNTFLLVQKFTAEIAVSLTGHYVEINVLFVILKFPNGKIEVSQQKGCETEIPNVPFS